MFSSGCIVFRAVVLESVFFVFLFIGSRNAITDTPRAAIGPLRVFSEKIPNATRDTPGAEKCRRNPIFFSRFGSFFKDSIVSNEHKRPKSGHDDTQKIRLSPYEPTGGAAWALDGSRQNSIRKKIRILGGRAGPAVNGIEFARRKRPHL